MVGRDMDATQKLREHIKREADNLEKLTTRWLQDWGKGSDEWSLGDPVTYGTPLWVRFLLSEVRLHSEMATDAKDLDTVFEILDALSRTGRLLFSAIAHIETVDETRFFQARAGGQGKHLNDPKQAEKKFVLECWRDWNRDPTKYKGKAAFARDMLDKCEHLQSQKKIEDWCREWEKSEPC